MSQRTPHDEYDPLSEDGLDALLDAFADGPAEDDDYDFARAHLTPDARPVQERSDEPAEDEAERAEPVRPRRMPEKTAGEDRPRSLQPVMKKTPALSRKRPKRLTRRERRELEKHTRLVPESPTIGRDLRGDQMLVYDSELDEVDYTDQRDLPEFRDYMPIRFARHGRTGVGGGVLYGLFVISVSIILACMAWMFASDMLALNKEVVYRVVTIDTYEPTGDMPLTDDDGREIKVDIDQVASALKNAGIIEYRWLFKLYSRFSHAYNKIDPGTYDVTTEDDYHSLVIKMQFGSGSQEITRVTFPEGYSMEQIFYTLQEYNICKVEDLYEAAANHEFDYDFLAELELGDANRLEGYLFPDTYDFYQGESAVVAINRFLQNMENKLSDEILDEAEARGLSIREMLIEASLIEKEAGSAEEMPVMASVINNRLKDGMPLQIDATINYIKGTSTLDITYADTEIDDPYNTYMYEGLPPGPICNPGLAAIEAVLSPQRTDYWYWYSVDGETHFFSKYSEFEAFVNANPN